jgi:hypothetical protein
MLCCLATLLAKPYIDFKHTRCEHKDLCKSTSGKWAFGLDPLVPAAIWAGTKGPATSPQNRLAAREALVPARNEPLDPV